MNDTITMSGQYDGVPSDILTAVKKAHENVLGDDRDIYWSQSREHGVASFSVNYPEWPVLDDDGTLLGWTPPYRTRERVDEELRELLPEGYAFEAANNTTTTIYED